MKVSRYVGFFVLILSLSGTQAIEAFSFKRDRSEPSITTREVAVNSVVQAPRDTDVEIEDKSSSYQLPDDLPNVLINQELIDAAQQRLSQSPEKYPLTHRAYQDIKARAKDFYDNVSISKVPVYTGTNRGEYRSRVYNGLARSFELAIICVFEDQPDYCQKAIDIILAWAEQKGGTQLTRGSKSNLSASGLDISRYFARYAQAFHLVSPYMSEDEKETVTEWFLELGYEIKKSHEYWIENLEREGANNHLSWHNEGMLIAALYGEDQNLLDYLMKGNRWNYKNLVRDAIYEQNNPDNIFRANRDFAHLPIQARTGEIYDRHRSLPHPPAKGDIYNRQRWWNQDVKQRAGFAYSMFNLEALILAAHIAQLNDLYYTNRKRFIDVHNQSIRNALRFYGEYYLDLPEGRSDCEKISEIKLSSQPYGERCPIEYEPYFGERPPYHQIYLFTIAREYYRQDKPFYDRIISVNEKEVIPTNSFRHTNNPVSIFTFFFAET
ncbi:MAG: alginate lyase family protein [Cyanobacteria bacterium J06592_8]